MSAADTADWPRELAPQTGPANWQPSMSSQLNDRMSSPSPSPIGRALRIVALCVGSTAVMAPWPLLGILLTRSLFDEAAEAFMLFGGITMFPLVLLALFGPVSKALLIWVMMLVWAAAAVVPDVWLHRRLSSWKAVVILLSIQSAFSFAQAVMGAFLVVGKSV